MCGSVCVHNTSCGVHVVCVGVFVGWVCMSMWNHWNVKERCVRVQCESVWSVSLCCVLCMCVCVWCECQYVCRVYMYVHVVCV